MKNFIKKIFPFAFLLILCVVFFLPIFTDPEKIIKGSDISMSYAWKSFVKEELTNGRLPLWNPNDRTGTPYFAHIGTEMWYPTGLLFVFLPIFQAMNVSLFLHVLMSGIFTYLFGRSLNLSKISSLTAAVCFAFGGYLPARVFAGHREVIMVIAWIPVIFFFSQKYFRTLNIKFLVLGGFSLGLQMLGTYPTVFVYTLQALAIYIIFASLGTFRFRLISLIKMTLIGIGISSILLIPFLEYSLLLTRNTGFSYEQSVIGSFPVEFLATFINPFAYGSPLNGDYTGPPNFMELTYYPGIFTLILASLSLFGLKKNLFSSKAFWVILAVMFFIALGEYNPFYKIIWNLSVFYQKTRIPARQLIIFCFAIAVLAGIGSHFLKKRFLKLLFLCLIIFDLFYFGKKFISVSDPEFYLGDKKLFSFLSKDNSLFRLYPTYDVYSYSMRVKVADLGTPLIHNVATVKTYDPFILKKYHDFTNKIEGINYYDDYNTPLSNTSSELLNFLNAKYFLTPFGVDLLKQDPKRFKTVLESPNYKLFENKDVLPRFYLEPKNEKDKLEIVKNFPTEITFRISSESDTRLVSSEIYYPGWHATIDGKETDFNLIYDTFRGLDIPKGSHEIRWYFLPNSLLIGALISLSTLSICLFLLFKK